MHTDPPQNFNHFTILEQQSSTVNTMLTQMPSLKFALISFIKANVVQTIDKADFITPATVFSQFRLQNSEYNIYMNKISDTTLGKMFKKLLIQEFGSVKVDIKKNSDGKSIRGYSCFRLIENDNVKSN